MMTPEGKVKAEIHEYLKEIGAYQYWPVPMGYGRAAVDVFVCWRGWFVAIEVKRPPLDGRKPVQVTKRQAECLHEVAEASGATVVAYSVDDVKRRIDELTRRGV